MKSTPRLGSSEAADRSLALIRATRHRIAGTVRSALLELDRYGATAFPLARRAQITHERDCLKQALDSLLLNPPPVELAKNDPLRDLELVQ